MLGPIVRLLRDPNTLLVLGTNCAVTVVGHTGPGSDDHGARLQALLFALYQTLASGE